MYAYILILAIIFLIAYFALLKKDLFESIFQTVFLILTVWINIPCFADTSGFVSTNMNLM